MDNLVVYFTVSDKIFVVFVKSFELIGRQFSVYSSGIGHILWIGIVVAHGGGRSDAGRFDGRNGDGLTGSLQQRSPERKTERRRAHFRVLAVGAIPWLRVLVLDRLLQLDDIARWSRCRLRVAQS